MDIQCIFNYLKELQENNNRDWYHEHKNERLYANEQFEHLLRELILEIGKFDKNILHNEPKNITFKLVRDIRYSHDKSPYNATFRAHIAPAGKLPIPVGYFIVCIMGLKPSPLGETFRSTRNFKFRKKKKRNTKLEVIKWKTTESRHIVRMILNIILYGLQSIENQS